MEKSEGKRKRLVWDGVMTDKDYELLAVTPFFEVQLFDSEPIQIHRCDAGS